MKEENSYINLLIREFKDIDLIDEFLETLDDLNMLNKKGKEFRQKFWEKYIKEDGTEES